jgi:hypothetical protein
MGGSMLIKGLDFEALATASGSGVFGYPEFDILGNFMLRVGAIRTTDMSGSVRIFFSHTREQVVSGKRFDPMGSGLNLLRPATAYKVTATLGFLEGLPEGIMAIVVPTEEAIDLFSVMSPLRYPVRSGPVEFTIMPYRKLEIEPNIVIASLMLFSVGDCKCGSDKPTTRIKLPKASSRVSKRSKGAGREDNPANQFAVGGQD